MVSSFTQDDLIRFIYKETSAAETIAIAEALESDPSLYRLYDELMRAYLDIPAVQFRPSERAIDDILRYSRQTALEAQP
ncbi:MAG: hypothetical protein D6765_11560 [Bacteroidetes bacterium]|nr:MAG: hypothetical protein D6765_11560 [Bacteroidota bacterium]